MGNPTKDKVNIIKMIPNRDIVDSEKELKSLRNLLFVFCFFVFIFGAMVGLYFSPLLNTTQPTLEQQVDLSNVDAKQLETQLQEHLSPQTLQALTQAAKDAIKSLRPKRAVPNYFSPRHLDPIEFIQSANTNIDQDKEKLREKRRAEMKLKELKKQAALCAVQTPQHCGDIFREIYTLTDEINTKFTKMKEIVDSIQPNLKPTTRKSSAELITPPTTVTPFARNSFGEARPVDERDSSVEEKISILSTALQMKNNQLEEVMSSGGLHLPQSELEIQLRKDIKELKRRLKEEKRRRKLAQGIKVEPDCGSSEELQADGSCQSKTFAPTDVTSETSISTDEGTTMGLLSSSPATVTETEITTPIPNRYGYWPTPSVPRSTYAPLTFMTTPQFTKQSPKTEENNFNAVTSTQQSSAPKASGVSTTEFIPRAFMDTEGHLTFINNSTDDLDTDETRLTQHMVAKINDGSQFKPFQQPKHRAYLPPVQEDLYRAKSFHGGHAPPAAFEHYSDYREMNHNRISDDSREYEYERRRNDDFHNFRQPAGVGLFQGQASRFDDDDDSPLRVDIRLDPDREFPSKRFHDRKPLRGPPPHPEMDRWTPVAPPSRRRDEDDINELSAPMIVNVPDRAKTQEFQTTASQPPTTTITTPFTTLQITNEKSEPADSNSLKRLDDDKRVYGVSGTFMGLCEQAIRERALKTVPVSSVGQVPPTGQTSKAEAQLILTPGFNPAGAPVCYFGNVPQPVMPNMYGQYYGPQPYAPYPNMNRSECTFFRFFI